MTRQRRHLEGPRRATPVPIRLLVGAGAAWAALFVCGCDGKPSVPPPVVEGQVPTIRVLLTAAPVAEMAVATGGAYRVLAGGHVVAESSEPLPICRVSRRAGAWRLGSTPAPGDELRLESVPDGGSNRGSNRGSNPGTGGLETSPTVTGLETSGWVALDQTCYRGRMVLRSAGPDTFHAVNHVDIESYLAGVLPKELFPGWHLQTYCALAVAARTFALYQKVHFGPNHAYDVTGDQRSQVYGGLSAETDKSRQAVRTTRGVVLTCGETGRERIFLTQYSACCGGWVNPAAVLRDAPDLPPLAGGQRCDDCRDAARYRWQPVTVGKAALFQALATANAAVRRLGGVQTVRVRSATDFGRPLWVEVVGPGGTAVIRADEVRLALLRHGPPAAKKLYSMNCTIRDLGASLEFCDGRGFGHGVGLCQWGAEGKARRGWAGEQILDFYYPGAKRFRAY